MKPGTYVAGLALLLAPLTLSITAPPVIAATIDEAMSYDGLEKTTVPGIELAYTLPGASLASYTKVLLEPIDVSFRKDWNPKVPGSPFKLGAKDREMIRAKAKTIITKAFEKEIQTNGGYPIVNEAGPDVLRVKVHIVNLYVTAPDVMTAGRSQTYTVSAGEMTLVAELSDSETGAVLARAVDRREARSAGGLRLSNSVTNTAAADSVASKWARVLRNSLDSARGNVK